jgi:hypothetical protein
MAIVHIAIFDAVNASTALSELLPHDPAPKGTSSRLRSSGPPMLPVSLYPSQGSSFDGWLAQDLFKDKNQLS